jgi:hypothetical protein
MDKTWLETCLAAGEFLYGEFPVTVLQKLYATRGEKISKEEIMEFYDESYMMLCDGEMFTPLIVTEGEMLKQFKDLDAVGNPYASLHFDLGELQYLRKENQTVADQPYWIPTASQIEELMEKGYIGSTAMELMEEKVKSAGGDPAYLISVWQRLSTDKLGMMDAVNAVISGMYSTGDLEEGSEIPEDRIASIPRIEELNAIMPMVNEFLNHVNLRVRKGWPPAELSKKKPRHQGMPTIMPGSASFAKTLRQAEPQLRAMGANVDYSSIDSFATVGQFGERRVVKVGRNDPCPCGSGKKYKHCHGR